MTGTTSAEYWCESARCHPLTGNATKCGISWKAIGDSSTSHHEPLPVRRIYPVHLGVQSQSANRHYKARIADKLPISTNVLGSNRNIGDSPVVFDESPVNRRFECTILTSVMKSHLIIALQFKNSDLSVAMVYTQPTD
ncbi:hypothetical protein HAX54_030404 [Datura stramonium]|uniref:Uncharacterized protein n=1 Tax=Datura stramonium TaxID=4076 RepID=A0ABS8V8M8_DATST|nr:hypothetical protein [Datura stramonium]